MSISSAFKNAQLSMWKNCYRVSNNYSTMSKAWSMSSKCFSNVFFFLSKLLSSIGSLHVFSCWGKTLNQLSKMQRMSTQEPARAGVIFQEVCSSWKVCFLSQYSLYLLNIIFKYFVLNNKRAILDLYNTS